MSEIKLNVPNFSAKKLIESVIDFFLAAISFTIALNIFTDPKVGLTENGFGIAIATAIGLGVWKLMAKHKLVDKP